MLPHATMTADITPSEPNATRGPSGFFNERALLRMIDEVYARVRDTLRGGRFALLYGGDCAALLGAVPAMRDTYGTAGLLFIDAHEDATTMEASTTGEAANMEIALLLGLTGSRAPESLRGKLPALEPDAIVMLGQRDQLYRREIEVSTIADRVTLRSVDEVHQAPPQTASDAVERLDRHASAWWLHVDLDVLSADEFPACGAARDPAMPGGLTWVELTAVACHALRAERCRGMSVGVYNTDLDPDRGSARRIVRFLSDVVAGTNPPTPAPAIG